MSRVVDDDKTFKQLFDLTLREKKLLGHLLSKDKSRPQSPGVGVLQTRFSPCPLSTKERESISILRKEKNYSSSSNSSSNSADSPKKPAAPKLSSSGSRRGTKEARISFKGETYDINVSLTDGAKTAIENANQRHKEELGKCWTSTIPKEFITREERHTSGNLIREMAMEKVSFFLTFDRTPENTDYYDKIFSYVNDLDEEEDEAEKEEEEEEDIESFECDFSECPSLELKTFNANCPSFCGGDPGSSILSLEGDMNEEEENEEEWL